MIIDEAFNADRLIEFLEALVKDAAKKVFLILDNLRVHHSKPVKAWVAERQDKIELFYLPSYSPELNPEERLNADLKHAIGTKVPARTKAKRRSNHRFHSRNNLISNERQPRESSAEAGVLFRRRRSRGAGGASADRSAG